MDWITIFVLNVIQKTEMVEKDITYQELFDQVTADAYAMGHAGELRVELSQETKETLTDLSMEVLGSTNQMLCEIYQSEFQASAWIVSHVNFSSS